MRFRAWYDRFSDTINIVPDEGGGCLGAVFGLMLVLLLLIGILNFLSLFTYSIVLLLIARKMTPSERRAVFLSVGNFVVTIIYCIGMLVPLFAGKRPTPIHTFQQIISLGIAIYSLVNAVRLQKQLSGEDQMSAESDAANRKYDTVRKFSIAAIGMTAVMLCLILFFAPGSTNSASRPAADSPSVHAVQTAQHQPQKAASVSLWELPAVVNYRVILGDKRVSDSYGNVYTGGYADFCAWNHWDDRCEPYLEVGFRQPGQYQRFTGTIFTRNNQNDALSITFKIYADKTCIFDSGKMSTSTRAISFDLDIAKAETLRLIAATDDDNGYCNPGIILTNAMVHS